jgi:hypothetical protein
MAKVSKTVGGMIPPRKPRGESDKVTIANQDNQIKLLVDRVEQLGKDYEQMRTWWWDERTKAIESAAALEKSITELTNVKNAYQRMLGWQDLARELLQPKSTVA